MKKFVVAFQRPYYPSIHLCDTLEEAERVRQEIIEGDDKEDGLHDHCFVLIAEVLCDTFKKMKTDY
jgi:hypothetical protein